MGVTERPVRTPCDWCGSPVEQPPKGRLLRYCNRSCRQRAYEVRAARRRLGQDVATGVIRTSAAERVVERVVQARHPRTVAGWEAALAELGAQIADGRLPGRQAERIRQALTALVGTAARAAADRPGMSPRAPVDERLPAVAAALLRAAGGQPTTLERLATATGTDIVGLRQVVLELEHLGLLTARRAENVVSIDELRIHARFILTTA